MKAKDLIAALLLLGQENLNREIHFETDEYDHHHIGTIKLEDELMINSNWEKPVRINIIKIFIA